MDSKTRKSPASRFEHRAGDFAALVKAIVEASDRLRTEAAKAVDLRLTLRNWLIGCYIREYEQRGSDRARYGASLLDTLSARLTEAKIDGAASRSLRLYRQFYLTYPRIWQTLSAESKALAFAGPIWRTLSAKSSRVEKPRAARAGESRRLLEALSFSHFAELVQFDDPLQRAFYEVECIRGRWSVREMKRQIASLYYERAGLSKNKKKLSTLAQAKTQPQAARDIIRDPYVFEFLGLKSKEVMGESDLENALLDKLEDFLLELGHGFCFEARQKRIAIGGEHFFVDLVFYHRVLKCHVLIELKLNDFNHEHLGQLNTYVNWYRAHEMSEGDNPPVGILLCTKKNHALVEYALAGIDNRLFVSKYQLELPKKEEIRRFIEKQMAKTVGLEKGT